MADCTTAKLVQLWIDLSTIQDAAEIAKKHGFHELAGNYAVVEIALKDRIADLEARQSRSQNNNRKKLAELNTILYAIPLSCKPTRKLVKQRIEEVKKEIQGNG